MVRVIDFNIDDFIKKNFIDNCFAGYDPYDYANSKYRFNNHVINYYLSFCNKISPINFRPILKIPKYENSKANALLLLALLEHDHLKYNNLIKNLIIWFQNNKSNEFSEISWGFTSNIDLSAYSSEPGKTSLIISLFVAYGFIKYYELNKDQEILKKIYEFDNILRTKWVKVENDEILWYSYLPHKSIEIFNATAKVGKFYAMMYKISNDLYYKDKIKKILKYLKLNQKDDCSWSYSMSNKYIDGFHTAFILEAINEMLTVYTDKDCKLMFEKGMEYYLINLFRKSEPLHFSLSDKTEDIRKSIIHTELRDCATAVILLSKIGDKERASAVIDYTFRNLYSNKDNYFYFYRNKLWISKIHFIRWQAWMLYAITVYNSKFKL